jgi:hypothetical protein
MPRNVHQLRVFIASPGDVPTERARLEKVVRELNLSQPSEALVQLELIRWETHTYPSFGASPQGVINEQIGCDFDIFIGILWSKVGTPTSKYPSGTLEEFQLAYKRWQEHPNSITLMIYFKDEPISPSQLDAGQLALIQAFKEQLSPSGGYYWTFKTVDDFETDVRLHLTRAIQDWRDRLKNSTEQKGFERKSLETGAAIVETNESSPATIDDDTDLGFLDYMELVDEATARHSAILTRMTSALEEIGKKAKERTAEAESLTAHPTIPAARLIFEQSAQDFNEFSALMRAALAQLSQAHADLLRYLVGGAASSLEMGAAGRQQVLQVLAQLDQFTNGINGARSQMNLFRGTVATLPRMMVAFNKAKRRASEVLAELDVTFSDLAERNVQVRADIASLLRRAEELG